MTDTIHDVVLESYDPTPLPDWDTYHVCVELSADTVRTNL